MGPLDAPSKQSSPSALGTLGLVSLVGVGRCSLRVAFRVLIDTYACDLSKHFDSYDC